MTYEYNEMVDEVLDAYWITVPTVDDPVRFTNEIIYHLKDIKKKYQEDSK